MKRFLFFLIIGIVAVIGGLKIYFIYAPVDPPFNVDPKWKTGPIVHLLPTVSHNRILLKASFKTPFTKPPSLKLDEKTFPGTKTDTKGYFWCFDAAGLEAGKKYELVIQDEFGKSLCDPWFLSTFPAPQDRPQRLKLLIYTGLGGHDAHIEWFGTGPLPLSTRIRLLTRALSFNPDALISSGDHIYYDLRYDKSAKTMGDSARSIVHVGKFDPSLPVLGTQNEEVLKKAVGPQIANLYGTSCRSIPTFFLLDDHDYFENDIATEKDGFDILLLLLAWRSPFFKGGVSFPPDPFMLDLGRTSQKLYLPEFLPDEKRPIDLPGSNALDRSLKVSECYGTLRYGNLVEGLLYESRRFTTLTGKDAVMTHLKAEDWLIQRMAAEEVVHVVNLPATVFGWSAGKWMEWYPDILGKNCKLTTSQPKYQWQEGWFTQQNRLLKAASSMKKSLPLFICGDLHCQGAEKILKSGNVDFGSNPILSVLSGSLGTGPRGFPSAFRGMLAAPPTDLKVEPLLPVLEKNSFVIVDFTPQKVEIQFFAWRPPEPVEKIDTLQPYKVLEFKVPGAF